MYMITSIIGVMHYTNHGGLQSDKTKQDGTTLGPDRQWYHFNVAALIPHWIRFQVRMHPVMF